jgi:FtsZ-binding cell division protein ZapB
MMATPELDTDSLDGLEERIHKAVALVQRLRQEKEAAKEAAASEAAELKAEIASQHQELEALRAERKQVRARIEKLLGHIDQLGA